MNTIFAGLLSTLQYKTITVDSMTQAETESGLTPFLGSFQPTSNISVQSGNEFGLTKSGDASLYTEMDFITNDTIILRDGKGYRIISKARLDGAVELGILNHFKYQLELKL